MREMKNILHGLKDLNIVGMDVVEVSPAYDSAGEVTVIAAAKLINEMRESIFLSFSSSFYATLCLRCFETDMPITQFPPGLCRSSSKGFLVHSTQQIALAFLVSIFSRVHHIRPSSFCLPSVRRRSMCASRRDSESGADKQGQTVMVKGR